MQQASSPKAEALVPIRTEADVVQVRQEVRRWTVQLGFKLISQTKLVTAASELARNALIYGGGGECRIEAVRDASRDGLRIAFVDHGPGIADLELAMRDGYTSGGGLGMGLPGTKRLVDDFNIVTKVGEGTTVTVTAWR